MTEPTTEPTPQPTTSFADDIMPIFAQFRGPMRWRMDLTRYADVRENAALIEAQLVGGSMPPPPFPPLSAAQVMLFQTWMAQGCPP